MKIDRHGDTWREIEARINARKNEFVAMLRKPITEREADAIRGRLDAYDEILKFAEPPKEIVTRKAGDGPHSRNPAGF